MSIDEWVSSRTAQALIGRTERQLRRYASSGRVRTRLQGNRVQYHRADVEALAAVLVPDTRPRVEVTEVMPPGALLDHIRYLETQIYAAAQREGTLQAERDAAIKRLEDVQTIQASLEAERQQRAVLEYTVAGLRRRVLVLWAVVVLVALLALALFVVPILWTVGH